MNPNHRQVLLEQQIAVLTMIARDQPFVDTIQAVIALAERLEPASIAGVTIVDRAERNLEGAVFGSVERTFSDAIAGVPLGPPHIVTCAQALYLGEVVTSEDLAADTRFANDWIKLCLDHDIRSCRSQPIRTANGNPLGTFMLCYREPRQVGRFDDRLMTVCSSLTELALERRRARGMHELLIGELQRKTGNLFAAVAALAHSTYQTSPDFQSFRSAIDGRLRAMASAKRRLIEEQRVDLRALVTEILGPNLGDRAIEMKGPPVTLPPDWTTSFSIAMHELATNATKYGALSALSGRLSVEWNIVRRQDGKAQFSFLWAESGGPPVTAPKRRGFGLRAVERLLAQAIGGKAQLDFAVEGVRCTVEAPLADCAATEKVA
jgi:two-component sensor histidine kinase